MAIPAIHALHRQGFAIDWVCGKAVAPLLTCYSWIHVIPADDKAILFGQPVQRLRAILALWQRLAWRKYDLCATLYLDSRYRLLTLPARRRRSVMLDERSRATTLLAVRNPADEWVRVLLGNEDGLREHSVAPLRPDRMPVPHAPQGERARRRIALFPGAGDHLIRAQTQQHMPKLALRRWPVESFVRVAEELCASGYDVLLMGSPNEAWVRSHFDHLPITDRIGVLSLPEVISECDGCDAVITHDTGPLHLAGLSSAALVGIFGPTNPTTLLPRRPDTVGIWGGQGFACRPCYDGRDFAPCQFNGCMHQVTPDLVLRELERLLEARARGIATPWRVVSPGDP